MATGGIICLDCIFCGADYSFSDIKIIKQIIIKKINKRKTIYLEDNDNRSNKRKPERQGLPSGVPQLLRLVVEKHKVI